MGLFPVDTWAFALEILGLIWDAQLSFGTPVSRVLSEAGVRRGVMLLLAGSSWALKTGVLRSSSHAPVASLSNYGMVTLGAGICSRTMRNIDTQLATCPLGALQVCG